jgi:PAS domain-containing protein
MVLWQMISDWIIIGISALLGLGLACVLMLPRRSKPRTRNTLINGGQSEKLVWVFDGCDLIDATASARSLLGHDDDELDWHKFHERLSPRFPDLPASPDEVLHQSCSVARAASEADSAEIVCEWLEGVVRVEIRPSSPVTLATTPNLSELDVLRSALEYAPFPVWRVEASGSVLWHNKAYQDLCHKVRGPKASLDTPLFPMDLSDHPTPQKSRRYLETVDGRWKLWFDVVTAEAKSARMYYATDINAVVDAEAAQRKFVQTLAKTFAQLSIGLAIFDRNRQLALFNPALIDLTALPASFLSSRPNLLSFFDRLRDQNMMPEPKDYSVWRQQIADLVEAASRGRYQETWSLPSGSVYSVSGRPHPDGAVAFLFEDITAEITLTRRFRSELELGQSVLDNVEAGIAVFSNDGVQLISNAKYRDMWSVDPDMTFAQTTIIDAVRLWQDGCEPNPVMGEIRDFVMMREKRAAWWGQVRENSGEHLVCSVIPIHNGSTMISFEYRDARSDAQAPRNLSLQA